MGWKSLGCALNRVHECSGDFTPTILLETVNSTACSLLKTKNVIAWSFLFLRSKAMP